jgi:hypothetical protein
VSAFGSTARITLSARRDPFDTPIDDIQTLRVDLAIVGGRAVHNPSGRFA